MIGQQLMLAWFAVAVGFAALATLLARAMDMLEPGGRDAGAIACFEIPGLPSVRE